MRPILNIGELELKDMSRDERFGSKMAAIGVKIATYLFEHMGRRFLH